MNDAVALGLEKDRQWLGAQAGELKPGEGGATVFVAGDEGSGRTALLQAFVDSMAAERSAPPVISGTFESGQYAPRNHAGKQLARARTLVEGIVAMAAPLHPLATLAAQVLSQSRGAWQVGEELASGKQAAHPLTLLPQLLRGAVQADGPLVCVIDDADKSDDGWWADLMLTFSRQIAVELPLLLVFAVEGPERLGPPEDGEPPCPFVAKQLVEERLASWRPLRRVTPADFAGWIGPADRDIPKAICEVTGGRAGWTAEVWAEWRRTGAVVRDDQRGWRFSDSAERQAPAPLNHLLGRRLQARMGKDDLALLARAQKVLALGALEGRVFTADAVAVALDQDEDEVIDLLDDWLLTDDPSDGQGLVDELPTISIADENGTRHLRRYRFRAQLDLLVLRHYGFGDEEAVQSSALAMAEALHSLYGAESQRVARSLTELFALAGDESRAGRFRHMHNVAADRNTMLWRARQVVDNVPGNGAAERDRAAWILLSAASLMYHSGPWTEGVRFTEAAARLATVLSLRSTGLYYAAWFHSHLNHRETARSYLEQALVGFEKVHDRNGVADANHQLASQDVAEGHYKEAEARYLKVLEMRRARNDPAGEAIAHEALGDLFYTQDDNKRARTEFQAALELARKAHRPLHEANTRFRLARIDHEEGHSERSRAAVEELLPVQRQYGDLHNQAASLILLADLEFDDERFEAALEAMQAASQVRERLTEPEPPQTMVRFGHIHWALDRHGEARAAYREGAEVAERAANVEGELTARSSLACLEDEAERWQEARVQYERVGEIEGALGDLPAQTQTLHRIAELFHLEERREQAAEAYLGALELARSVGDRERERDIQAALGDIASDEGDLDAAYDHLSTSLSISRELGDRDGEATTESYLATIELQRHGAGRDGAEQPRKRLTRALALQRELGDSEGEAVTLSLLQGIES